MIRSSCRSTPPIMRRRVLQITMRGGLLAQEQHQSNALVAAAVCFQFSINNFWPQHISGAGILAEQCR